MGRLMKEDDIYIGTLLELLNLRFAPPQELSPKSEYYGGILELQDLQARFRVFRQGRKFGESAEILGLGGLYNNRVKTRWYTLLNELDQYPSSDGRSNGDESIVETVIGNLERKRALPMYFKAHDSRIANQRAILLSEKSVPVFYMEQEYITVSIPMKPRPKPRAPRGSRA